MRRTPWAIIIAVAGFLWTLAAPHYLGAAPSIVARIALTGVGLVAWTTIAWIVFHYRPRKVTKMVVYVFVAIGGALFSVLLWWAIGRIPNENAVPPPAIDVTLNSEGSDFSLTVQNTGGKARFVADIEVLYGPPGQRRTYPGYWEKSGRPDTEMATWGQDRLILGGVLGSPPEQTLGLGYYDSSDRGLNYITRPIGDPQRPSPDYNIVVRIHADPPLAEGRYAHAYSFDQNFSSDMGTVAP